jgi:hypothetical protein
MMYQIDKHINNKKLLQVQAGSFAAMSHLSSGKYAGLWK